MERGKEKLINWKWNISWRHRRNIFQIIKTFGNFLLSNGRNNYATSSFEVASLTGCWQSILDFSTGQRNSSVDVALYHVLQQGYTSYSGSSLTISLFFYRREELMFPSNLASNFVIRHSIPPRCPQDSPIQPHLKRSQPVTDTCVIVQDSVSYSRTESTWQFTDLNFVVCFNPWFRINGPILLKAACLCLFFF